MREHSTRRLDLSGQRFGRLTVIAPAENIGRRTAWLCHCDCGGERIVKTVHLREGKVTSCGCAKEKHSASALGLHYVDGTCVEMLRANTKRRNNKSGVVGVVWRPESRRWQASIMFKGTRHNLGKYERFDDAAKARREAEALYYGSFLADFDAAQTASASQEAPA